MSSILSDVKFASKKKDLTQLIVVRSQAVGYCQKKIGAHRR